MPIIYRAALLAAVVLVSSGSARAESREILSRGARLVETGPDNSLERDPDLFRIRGKRSSVLFTDSTEVNIHAHDRAAPRSSSYRYSGEMRILDVDGGVGVTFHSAYPRADRYYRLRTYGGSPTFHIEPHGTSMTSGDLDTEVSPEAAIWYRFEAVVKTSRRRTRVFAKVWAKSDRKPRSWQVRCEDSSDTRIRNGRVGVWSMAEGRKEWRALRIDH